ncbi:MAG: hypothetical protein LBE12_01320 [Planctomycetaceae bacterium]|nr:hypothetical protein [Planctomycetaceae bacterium]
MFKKLTIFLSFLFFGSVLIFFIYTITLSNSIFAFNNTEDTTSGNGPTRIQEINWGISKDEECTYSGQFVTGDAALMGDCKAHGSIFSSTSRTCDPDTSGSTKTRCGRLIADYFESGICESTNEKCQGCKKTFVVYTNTQIYGTSKCEFDTFYTLFPACSCKIRMLTKPRSSQLNVVSTECIPITL